jgi:hypothetical protein
MATATGSGLNRRSMTEAPGGWLSAVVGRTGSGPSGRRIVRPRGDAIIPLLYRDIRSAAEPEGGVTVVYMCKLSYTYFD